MKTRAVRLYGKNDIRLEEFELPIYQDDEILARVVCDSICKSTYKAILQGNKHRHIPDDIAENPIIIGHELCGEIVAVGQKWRHQFQPGDMFSVQPKLEYAPGKFRGPGYSYPHFGGHATDIILPNESVEHGCVLKYFGDSFFSASLAEPMACIIRAFRASYHCESDTYMPRMGIIKGGNLALFAGCGPMGLAAIDYALHGPRQPKLLVMTCRNEERLKRAAQIFTVRHTAELGIELHYVNTRMKEDLDAHLRDLTGGWGYDDAVVFAPSKKLVEQADRLLAPDGCLNFFAGPPARDFSATCNFYNVHYYGHHIIGTFGGTPDDMREALGLMAEKKLNPATLITHIGGLNSVVETMLNLPDIPGMKKLIYPHIDLELTAIEEFEEKGTSNPLFADLSEITARHNGLWSGEAESYLLAHTRQ